MFQKKKKIISSKVFNVAVSIFLSPLPLPDDIKGIIYQPQHLS